MRTLIIAIALPLLTGCIPDRTYYTIYTPDQRLTNSSPAVPVAGPASTNRPAPENVSINIFAPNKTTDL